MDGGTGTTQDIEEKGLGTVENEVKYRVKSDTGCMSAMRNSEPGHHLDGHRVMSTHFYSGSYDHVDLHFYILASPLAPSCELFHALPPV